MDCQLEAAVVNVQSDRVLKVTLMTACICVLAGVQSQPEMINSAQLVAANTELKAKRTAYDLLHTDWLASQQDLKAHCHVLARLNTMYACSVPIQFVLPNQ